MKKLVVIAALAVFGYFLILTVSRMPSMGSPDTPTREHVIPRYLEKGAEEAGAENIVTDVIINYRGYDTAGEVTVIFTALCAAIALLDREKRGVSRAQFDISPVRASPLVRTVVRFTVPFIILFAVYIVTHGGSSPGGGFQGGAVIGASIIIFAVVFGLPESTRRIPVQARIALESTAVLAFIIGGLIGLLAGANFLTYLLPGVTGHAQELIREALITFIEIGIGVGSGVIFTSIVFAMSREEQVELHQAS